MHLGPLFCKITIYTIIENLGAIVTDHFACGSVVKTAEGGVVNRARVDGKYFSRLNHRLLVRGVTYGPFDMNQAGEPFPERQRVVQDFAAMKAIGINALRLYYFPPEWFLELADEHEMLLLAGIPWSHHLCFLDDPKIIRDARLRVRDAAIRGRAHSCLMGYVVANEISPHIMRWHGPTRVNQFLKDLMNVVKDADPEGLVTYANFPSTEYLDVSCFDFITFNVYLHEPAAFRRYVNHLQILAGDKPLLLGELGMDTIRHAEAEQAAFLAGHLREATLMGVAGNFVFSWTDDWHTGGARIEDWAFGITRLDRASKLACHAVEEVFRKQPSALLHAAPRVSVVVCSYNGASTLDECLRSLVALDYPDFEIILVDDGSSDNTSEIAKRFPAVRLICQSNQGLSAARNMGLQSATGSIIAYTDSDCFVDVNWLTHLVHQLESCDAVAVGGPNLTPDDGWIAACVAASPGQPTHVLESDMIAEHIPGCNMAYRREALEAINGFNPRYRKAGDDVDLCWRLQQNEKWITFAPGAFVWHHRRHTPGAYLKQQAGYGEAEGLLWFDHPDRFNARGESMWRGRMYGAASEGLCFGRPVIYHGVWGTGLFQTIYQPAAAHWVLLPSTLEWHFAALIAGAMMLTWPYAWIIAVVMLALSLIVAGLRAAQAPLAPKYQSLKARLLIAIMCYFQPLVRSWCRLQARLIPDDSDGNVPHKGAFSKEIPPGLRWLRGHTVSFWDDAWHDRTDLLRRLTKRFSEYQWRSRIDPGWDNWDTEVYCGMCSVLRIYTSQEDHGQGRRLIRVKYQLRSSAYARLVATMGLIFTALAAGVHILGGVILAFLIFLISIIFCWRGSAIASRVAHAVDVEAREFGLIRINQSES